MLLFSFEVDTLGRFWILFSSNNIFLVEIALREQQEFVDKIFLIESSFTHKGVRIEEILHFPEN